MTTATRTSGVAPLLVVFDAVDTASPAWTSGVVQPANIGDLPKFQYEWNFGDPDSGTWAVSSRPRNEDTGYVASHVFENPGIYVVTLKITAADDSVSFFTQTITVNAFSGTTYYVSSSTGNDSNPGTIASPLASFDAAINKNATNTRILFKRGDTFPTVGSRNVTAPGPGIIGAYGTGARPIVRISSGNNDNNILQISESDWRIMDIEFIGAGRGIDQSGSFGFVYNKTIQNFLALRVDASEFRVGLGWGDAPYPNAHNVAGVVDSHVHDNQINGVYVGAQHLAVLGNRIERLDVSHVLRVWLANKSVIAHNLLALPGGDRHNLKLHSPNQTLEPDRLKSEFIQIADNEIRGIGTWSVTLGPQDAGSDERVRHVIFERNRSYNAGIDLMIWARNVTVRNNIFDGSGPGAYYTAVSVGKRGIEPASDAVGIYNNTVYTSGTHREIGLASVESVVTNTRVENNLISAPNATVPVMLVDLTPSAGANNLRVPATDFVNAAIGNFRLNAGSAAIAAGIYLREVREDFTRNLRPPLQDLGAYER